MTHHQAARHDAGTAPHADPIPWQDFAPGNHRIKCPYCGKASRSDKTLGVTIEHTGDGVAHCFRCDYASSYQSGVQVTTGRAPRPHRPKQPPAAALPTEPIATLNDQGRALWDSCSPLTGTDGAAYLAARNCVLPPDHGHLRFHPALKHAPSGYVGPALVALVTHALTGQAMTLHRTWVLPSGQKADVNPPRMLLGGHSKQGGVIRLWPDECITHSLAVGEGVETCLSLAHAFTPVWALIDAGNMAALPVLPAVQSLLIARDRDPAGEQAAHACATRWNAAGVAVSVTAQSANDLNDEIAGERMGKVNAQARMGSIIEHAEVFLPLDTAMEAAATKQPSRVLLSCGSDLEPEPVRWLWKHWLALGKLVLLAGQPGQGKTTLALSLAATVTTGGRWPDGSDSQCGNVLVWSGEDDPADTLLPRLMAAGADRARCFFIQGTHINGEVDTFDPARDMGSLESAVQDIGGVRLLIVDPVVSAISGDDHKNSAVRRSLQPLVDLASKANMAILGISHFSKGGAGSDPASRVVGSVAFTAVARVVIVAAKSHKFGDEDNRIFARAKSNIGPDDGGFEYQIEQTETINGIHASYIRWGQSVEGNARDLLAEPEESEDQAALAGGAVEMLRHELTSETWTSADFARKALLAAGFTAKQIWKASNKLSVIRKKGGMESGWYWRLPSGSDAPPEDSIA